MPTTVTLAYQRDANNKHALTGYYGSTNSAFKFSALSYRAMMVEFAEYLKTLVGDQDRSKFAFKFKRTDRPNMEVVDIQGLAYDLLDNTEATIERLDKPPVMTVDLRKKKVAT